LVASPMIASAGDPIHQAREASHRTTQTDQDGHRHLPRSGQIRCTVGAPTCTGAMSASRDELHDLIDGLPDDQVAAVLADLKRRTAPRLARSTKAFSWVGMIKDGPTDASSREAIDAVLAQGFGR
jgi:hypothetical protein